CADGGQVPEAFPAKLLTKHCDGTKNDPGVKKAQQDYLANWVKPASEFFATPDPEDITTTSLEPAGDPRDLATLKGGELTSAMDKVNYELRFLYRVNFS